MSKKSKNIYLNDRDLMVFMYLYSMEYCTIDAISILFFKDCKTQGTVRKRLSLYCRNGFVSAIKGANCKRYYFLKRKGLDELIAKGYNIDSIKEASNTSKSNLEHTTQISKIRAILESQGEIRSWRSEKNLIQSNTNNNNKIPYIPDGIFTNCSGELNIFEYERTLKSKDRIKQRISELKKLQESFRQKLSISPKVFVVCENKNIEKQYRLLGLNHNSIFHLKTDLVSKYIKEDNER